MIGHGGLFRQENVEKRRIMSVREWAELCNKDEFRAPGVKDVGLHARSQNVQPKPTKRGRKKVDRGNTAVAEPDVEGDIKVEEENDPELEQVDADVQSRPIVVSPPNSTSDPATPIPGVEGDVDKVPDLELAEDASPSVADGEEKAKVKAKRVGQGRAAREANLAERAALDTTFIQGFDPHSAWLPPHTSQTDYTAEFCQKLERQYWRNCGLGKPPWYGADTQGMYARSNPRSFNIGNNHCSSGSLYTDKTTSWNVAHLPSTLSRILPASNKGLPGVNTPYLYFGMWRATFAWHVEDMDLFSINYIHFGAPKFWYAIPQGRSGAMEQTMRGISKSSLNHLKLRRLDRIFPEGYLAMPAVSAPQVVPRLSHNSSAVRLQAQYPCPAGWRIRHHVPQRLPCWLQFGF